MKRIPLTKGYWVTVDDEDWPEMMLWSWYAEEVGDKVYACRRDHDLPGKPKVYMHRQLLGAGVDQKVDHRDLDGLNNRRKNLRLATQAGNTTNRPKNRRNASSPFKGVVRSRTRWLAQIEHKGKRRHLGMFDDQVSAARAYDSAAKDLFGEFAYLNFPEQQHAA